MENFLRGKNLSNAEVSGLLALAFLLGHMLNRTDPRELQRAYVAGCLAQMRGQQQGQQSAPQPGAWWSQGVQPPQPSTAVQPYGYGQQPEQAGQSGLVWYDQSNPAFGQMR